MVLTAEVVDAQTALSWGLVDWVVSADGFEAKIDELAERALAMAWTSTRLSKKLTNMAFDVPFSDFVQNYFEYQRQSMASEEHRRAMAEYRAEKG